MRILLFILIFPGANLLGAQNDCLDDTLTHFESDMPKESFEWFFIAIDDQHTRASLLFPTALSGATFFQALAQQEDDVLYEYAFPLEVLDHPISTDAKQIEFIISNTQLTNLVINLHYLEQPYLVCSGKKSYSYFVRAL